MTDLERELAHARVMAKAKHKPDCPGRRPPHCLGCVSDADRALWRQLAEEYAAQLARHREDTLL